MAKRWIRSVAVLGLVALLLCSLCGCKGKSYAIRVGDQKITENDYKRTVATLRQGILYVEQAEDTKEFWKGKTESGQTRAQEVAQMAQEQLITAALYEDAFDRLGLSLSAEEELAITETVQQAVSAYGAMTAFNEALAQGYYTYDEYVGEYYAKAKKSKVLAHLFADVSEAELQEYYAQNYVYVKFIFISKEDVETGDPLSGSALEDARAKAQSALEAANRAGEIENFNDLIELYADTAPEESKGVLITDDDTFDPQFTKGAMALKVGETALIETEGAFMVTKRVDGKEAYTASVKQAILERIKAKEIAQTLEEWRGEVKIDFNKKLIKKYRADKM